MDFDFEFYLIDHRLIALAGFVVLAVACEIGLRLGSRTATRDIQSRRPYPGAGPGQHR